MLLLGLFVFRVIAQLLVLNLNLPLLPPFDAWHSALLPYPTLVAAQIAEPAVAALPTPTSIDPDVAAMIG